MNAAAFCTMQLLQSTRLGAAIVSSTSYHAMMCYLVLSIEQILERDTSSSVREPNLDCNFAASLGYHFSGMQSPAES